VSRLPQVSGRDVVRVLKQVGYEQDHMRGSHIVMRQIELPYRRITVPDHNPVAKGTLRAIIRQSGLTVEEFIALL
jgi:predicted RNA binding protein YcfA (HicA-like mRNA interferase family)